MEPPEDILNIINLLTSVDEVNVELARTILRNHQFETDMLVKQANHWYIKGATDLFKTDYFNIEHASAHSFQLYSEFKVIINENHPYNKKMGDYSLEDLTKQFEQIQALNFNRTRVQIYRLKSCYNIKKNDDSPKVELEYKLAEFNFSNEFYCDYIYIKHQ